MVYSRCKRGSGEGDVNPRLVAHVRMKGSRARPTIQDGEAFLKNEVLDLAADCVGRSFWWAPPRAVSIAISTKNHLGGPGAGGSDKIYQGSQTVAIRMADVGGDEGHRPMPGGH